MVKVHNIHAEYIYIYIHTHTHTHLHLFLALCLLRDFRMYFCICILMFLPCKMHTTFLSSNMETMARRPRVPINQICARKKVSLSLFFSRKMPPFEKATSKMPMRELLVFFKIKKCILRSCHADQH